MFGRFLLDIHYILDIILPLGFVRKFLCCLKGGISEGFDVLGDVTAAKEV